MAFLPGIFGRAPAPAPAAPVAAAPVAPAPASTGGPVSQQQAGPANPAANPANMTGQPAAAPAAGPQNPLDSFADMFKPRPVDPNAQKAPTLADPLLTPLDPAAFKQQVAQANFAAAIPQDTIQKAMGGDATAFAEAINMAAREAFAAATQVSHNFAEHGARTAAERVNSTMDSRIRNFQIKSQNTTNEALTHPAVAPMLNAVKVQLATSNPTLTPEQVQQQAEAYFTQMADVLTAPQRQAQEQAAKPKAQDFSYLLNS